MTIYLTTDNCFLFALAWHFESTLGQCLHIVEICYQSNDCVRQTCRALRSSFGLDSDSQ